MHNPSAIVFNPQAELERLKRKILSPVDNLIRLKNESANLENLAWYHIGLYHKDPPDFYDDGFVNPKTVGAAINEIAKAYNLREADDTLKTALYLGYRARFLNCEHAFYAGDVGLCLEHQYNDDGEIEAPFCICMGYAGSSGPEGDIVDFERLNPHRFSPDPLFPTDEFWALLTADYECPTGIVSYHAAYRKARRALVQHIVAANGQTSIRDGIRLLADLLPELDPANDDMIPWLCFATHGMLLSEM